MRAVKRVVIVGGGTAGWMAAAALGRSLGKQVSIDLIESDAIGTVGVGEATIPPIRNFHLLLELDEADFLRETNGTYKLGIEFENWGQLGERYFHPFSRFGVDAWAAQFHHYWVRSRQRGEHRPLDDFSFETVMARAGRFGPVRDREVHYAYHLDAGRYAALLRRIAEGDGVRRTEGRVVDVKLDGESGDIDAVQLESGEVLEGDLFIDCSGFRGLLIEQALETGWEDWSQWIRNDRAIAVQTEAVAPPVPYTRATARSAGWQWKIPLQTRVGNGLVYGSDFLSDDEALKLLRDNLDGAPITEPRPIRFRTGRRELQWNRNCVALGLSSGFLEPLESTSIHLIQNSIIRLIKLFPGPYIEPTQVDEFNREVKEEFDFIRDFIILHYHVTRRADSPYWNACREMSVPDSLAHRIEMFRSSGRIFRQRQELFDESSWIAVMVGQGLEPQTYHPFVDRLSDDQLGAFMAETRSAIAQDVNTAPVHRDFIAHRQAAV
ncbi:MAG: tryptophan halogenase family protein [Pseudomonadota bacterium]